MMTVPGYESLAGILQRAYDQAAAGKGKERHAGGRPFTAQPMQTISDLLGSHDGLLYQAMKKIQESKRLDRDAAIRELLGAINYIAGAVIFMESKIEPLRFGMDLGAGSEASVTYAVSAVTDPAYVAAQDDLNQQARNYLDSVTAPRCDSTTITPTRATLERVNREREAQGREPIELPDVSGREVPPL